jgi:hypothetical protein
MPPPKIQGFGITQQRSATSWDAMDSVDDVGRLEAWGSTLIAALEALQARASPSRPSVGCPISSGRREEPSASS